MLNFILRSFGVVVLFSESIARNFLELFPDKCYRSRIDAESSSAQVRDDTTECLNGNSS